MAEIDFGKTPNDRGGRPWPADIKTRAVISPQIRFRVGGKDAGFIQRCEARLARDVTPKYEVGTIGAVDMIPGQPSYALSITSLRFYDANLIQRLLNPSETPPKDTKDTSNVDPASQWTGMPSVQIYIKNPSGTGNTTITYHNVWFTSYTEPVELGGDQTVIETAELVAEYRTVEYL